MVEVIYIPLYPSTGLQDQVECQDFPMLLPEMIFFICFLLLAIYVVIEIICVNQHLLNDLHGQTFYDDLMSCLDHTSLVGSQMIEVHCHGFICLIRNFS